ncbi:MAG: S8 family peptidase [Acidobacteriota bacterium]
MARNLEHLELPSWEQPLQRRRQSRGRYVERDSRQEHGQMLIEQAEQIANRLQQRQQTAPQGINPKLIFKLQLNPKGYLDERQLEQMGLQMLARDSRRAVVVFPDESTLNELRRRLRSYAQEEQYQGLAAIDAIQELSSGDRLGSMLRIQPLENDEFASLDIELWHTGNRQKCQQNIGEIQNFLGRAAVTDSWIGENICLIRAKVNAEMLALLLEIDYIKEIDRRPAPTFEMLDVARLEIAQLQVEQEIPGNLVGILIIDSGVMQKHPLIGLALGDAQVFPDSLRERIAGGAEDGDQRSGGHGTAVAGIALYNNVGECISNRTFLPSARLFSARVTDDQNEYDENELVEHQLEEAIDYFLNNYPAIKVINISLGDSRLVYSSGNYQFRFASTIDELAHRYRDREIIFVISTGNFFPTELSDEEIFQQYPTYLLDEKARLIDPATSALALTVGGLSYGSGRDIQRHYDRGIERLVAGEEGWPSPFTRTGLGVDGSIKPDVVDFAGDWKFERGRISELHNINPQPAYAGLPSTAKNFAPPDGKLFRTVAGTSFAAPRVANLAAQLFGEFPTASSNLIRALIADSARIPQNRPLLFSDRQPWDKDLLRVYGYGHPDFARARWSDNNEVLLMTDGLIDIDSFQIFQVPSLPQEFLTAQGKGCISVSLAFDPPTRHTRGDSYLGVTMEFCLFRNIEPESITEALRAWNRDEIENIGGNADIPILGDINRNRLKLNPRSTLRKKGTLQRGSLHISNANWQYDGNSLYLAVICQRKWAPVDITSQRFAVVVSLSHENPTVDIYAHVYQQTRISQRTRIRI